MLALLISSGAWLLLGQGIKRTIDDGFIANNPSLLNQMLWVVIGIALVGSLATYLRFYWMIWLGERVSADIRQNVYRHLLTLSPAFFAQTRTGEVISRFTADTTLLQSVVGTGLSMVLRASVTLLGSLILMFLASPLLTLYVLIAVPLVLVPIRVFGRKVRTFAKNSQDKVADVGAYIDETLHEIHTVQAYGHESLDNQNFTQRIDWVMQAAHQRIRFRAMLVASIIAISVIAIAWVAWFGAQLVLSGALSAGELTAFMFYAVLAGGAVATISEVIGEIQKAAGASERLLELLNTQNELRTPECPLALPQTVKGNIQLEDVSFYYPSAPQKPALDKVSLHIEAGQRVAIVGPSGAGKSTLFQLLLRFYDISSGSITLEGRSLADLSIAELRAQYALVPQESVIFASSVKDNIKYGRADASDEQVIDAARAAQAHDFIEALPNGYDSQLGERGVNLSGGQKQRIAIARAILADRPILLLDEATSALDAANETYVKQALEKLMVGKTSLVIAHRLATVVNADRIIVMQDGKIVATGTHQSLLASNDLYREFANMQWVDGLASEG
jgi:ATP-binding cassette subfamily B protein